MRGPRARARAGCRALAVIVCVPLAAVLVAAGAPAQRSAATGVPAVLPAVVPLAVPTATPPRIAFTDARDAEEYATDDEGEIGLALAPPPTTHTGETSVNGKGVSAGVSTVDEPHGEVYVTDPDGSDTHRITCDNAVESHPVVSPDGTRVAYASNASGTFRLWLGAVPDAGPEPEPLLGSVPSCDGLPLAELAGAPGGENLWPGWVGDDRLVFSGTGLDPLGDIWIVDVGSAASPVLDAPAQRLTAGLAAETQPSYGFVPPISYYDPGSAVVVFTTTEFRRDGSLGYVVLPDADASPPPSGPPVPFAVQSLWADGTPQSTEGVWSPDGRQIAYTTTDRDPYGDVDRATVTQSDGSTVNTDATSAVTISAVAGRAESHPAWLPPPGEGEDQQWRYTLRTATGDVSDVVASDGSGRRTIASDGPDRALDESTPTYSPDGTRIAYSRTAPLAGGREIVMADADGGDVVVLDRDRLDDAIDVEPAWSPDGTRIAFVRFPGCECSFRTSEIWVADVHARTAHRVTTVPEDTAYWDENPSWSPDGSRLVIARAVEHLQPDLEVWIDGPPTVEVGEAIEVTVHVDNRGRGTANDVVLTLSGPVPTVEVPAGVRLEPADDACRSAASNTLSCDIERIPSDDGATVTVRVVGGWGAGNIVRASVAVTGAPAESDTTNNTTSKTFDVTTPPDVSVQVAPPSFASLGLPPATVTLTFTVHNYGTRAAGSVVLEVTSAAVSGGTGAVSLTSTSSGCTASPLRCSLGDLESGADRTVVVTVSRAQYGAVVIQGAVEPVPGEVETDNNVARVNGTLCCPPPSINAAISSALLADSAAAGEAPAQVNPPTVVREAPDAPADPTTTLWVIDARTGTGHELRGTGTDPRAVLGRGPAWSPDGLRVAYEHQGSVLVLHLADPHGDAVALRPGTERPLIDVVTGFTAWSETEATPSPSRTVISVAEDPAWSPDGKQLAVSGQPAGQPDQRGIYRIEPDGTDLTVVAQGRGPETEPAWQPWADLAVTLTAVPAMILIGTESTLTAKVSNSGPTRASGAVLEVAVPTGLTVSSVPATCTEAPPGLVSCDVGALASEASAAVDLPVKGTTVGTHLARADVGSPVPDPVVTNNTATATVEVTLEPPVTDVSVTVRMDPDPGYVGGTGTLRVEVTNSASGTATGIQVTISHPAAIVALVGTSTCFTGTACSIGTLAPGGRRTLTAPVRFKIAGTGALTASVTSTVDDTNAANDRATRTVTVKKPVVRILQPIGTPGSIAMAVGEEFPPGSRVLLTWDQGLNQREIRVVVAPDGSMPPTQVLVFRRDQIGTRLLLANPQDPTQYTAVSVPMLVTPRTVTPPADFVSRN